MPTRTFLFVDQVRSTQQLTALGDQAAHEIRRALFDLLRQATEVSGGQEVDFTGDGLFCAFEGAAEAADAAILMQELCASFNERQTTESRLALRIGLNAGEPLTSEGGGYFGVAVVVASRLCSTAQEGQILVSHLVRSLVEPRGVNRFDLIGDLSLRGVPEPVTTYALHWESDARPIQLPGQLADMRSGSFVGRNAERHMIESAWNAVKAGGRRFVLVSGDRGHGVSRLMAEMAEQVRVDGAAVWYARAEDRMGRLVPWSEAVVGWAQSTSRAELRMAMGSKASDLLRVAPGLADLVPRLPPPAPMNPSSEVFLVAEALDELCARWSQHQPVLLVLDDLENADPASLTVLRRLVGSTRPARLMIMGGYEPSEVGTPHLLAAVGDLPDLVDLRLAGLSAGEVEELITSITHEPITPASLRAVLAESEGSPYFVRQMAGSMRERALTRQVHEAVGQAEVLRTDLRLRREEIVLGLRQLEQLRSTAETSEGVRLDPDGTPPAQGLSPYQGLMAFAGDDADNFFGRETLSAELIARLVSSRFLAVVGPSGSGKSSVVNAGVLPALAGGAVPGSETWVPVVCRPGAEQVEDAVAEARQLAHGRPLVVFVDQFEELWTQYEPDVRKRVLDLLVATATDPDSADVALVAMRADYYGRAAEHPALASLMAESHVLAGPMSAAELRAAIESPAKRAGLVLEPGLAQAILDDLGDQPGNLPLLSTALLQTWERRRGRSLTLTAYAETGGARRAIAQLADSTFDELTVAEQEIARRILLRLAAPGIDGDDVARPAALAEFADDDQTKRVLARLVDRRLVTVGSSMVQVAHEAVLREWPRLRGWLDADRDGRRLHQQIAIAAVEWQNTGRDDAALLRGARLAAAEDWRTADPDALTAAERDYVTASIEARGAEVERARRAARRLRLLALGLVILLVGAMVTGGFALVQRQEATKRANEADARGLAAQAISLSSSKVDTAMLLAVESYRRDPSLESRTGLLSALNGARYLTGYHPTLPRDAYDMALTPDRKTVVVMTNSGDLRRFDTATWQEIGDSVVRGVKTPGIITVSRDGQRVAYGADDGVRTVNLRSGEQVGKALGGPVGFAQQFSRDGSVLVTSTEGAPGARAFDLASGRKLGEVRAIAEPASLDVSPRVDEMVVAPAERPSLRRYRFDGSPIAGEVSVEDRGAVRKLSYTPDGKRIAVVHDNGVVQVVDATTLAPVGRPFTGHGDSRVVDLALSPSSQLVAAASDDGSVRIAEVETGGIVATVTGLVAGPALAEFFDEDRLLALTTGEAAEFDLRRTTNLGTASPRSSAVLSLTRGSGQQPVVNIGEETAFAQIVADGGTTEVSSSPEGSTSDAVAVSPDGSVVGWHAQPQDPGQPGTIVFTEAASGKLRGRVPIPGDDVWVTRLAFSTDGGRLAVGNAAGKLTIIDVRAGKVIVGDKSIDFSVLAALRWSEDGSSLYAGGQDGLLKTLDPTSGTVLASVPVSPGTAITDIELIPESSLVAVASESGFVSVVDTASGQLSGEPLSGTGLQAVAVSPNGQQIAALGGDGAIRLWDRTTRRAIGVPLDAHRAWAFAMDYLDDNRLVTGGLDRQLISWDLSPDSWVKRACELAGRDLTAAEWEQYLPERPYRRTCSG